jgi:hypothetical protein
MTDFSSRLSRRSHPILALFCACVVGLIATASSTARDASAVPPNGVFTCKWIAAHPTAALQARVTCDPKTFALATTGAPHMMQAQEVSTLSQGCAFVPNTGRVGQGVFAWTSYQYSNQWSWQGEWNPSDYTWYIKRTNGTTVAWNRESTPCPTASTLLPTYFAGVRRITAARLRVGLRAGTIRLPHVPFSDPARYAAGETPTPARADPRSCAG